MSTAITLQESSGGNFLGRTFDSSYMLEPEIYIFPRNYEWVNLTKTSMFRNKYSYIGIGKNISKVILADGVNERGFAIASMHFPGYACYECPKIANKKAAISALEVTNFLLGMCACVEQVSTLLGEVQIVGIEDNITKTVVPLHWIATDRSGKSIVIEKTRSGLHICNNPIGVLTNSPEFNWHMTNLMNYSNISRFSK